MKTLGLFGTFMVAGFIVILIGDFFVPWVSALLFLAATFFFVDFVVATFFVGGDTTLLLGLALTGEPEEAARPFETFFTELTRLFATFAFAWAVPAIVLNGEVGGLTATVPKVQIRPYVAKLKLPP